MSQDMFQTPSSSGQTVQSPNASGTSDDQTISSRVTMYSIPNVLTQSTQSTQSTPTKESEEAKTPTPKKPKRYDLTHVQEKVGAFTEAVDTEVRACLYSVSINDTEAINTSLKRVVRKNNAFNSHMSFAFKECIQSNAALKQRVGTLERYCNNLHREKQDLQREITELKRRIQEREQLSQQLSPQEQQELEELLLKSDDDCDLESPKKAKTD